MNKYLHGNGHWCPSCKGTGRGRASSRIVYDGGAYCDFYERCKACNGEKRLAGPGPKIELTVHTCMSQLIEWGRET